MINLVNNAIKFSKDRGEIFIKVKAIESNESTQTLLFSVQDTGIGIPLERHSKLFKAFSQADSSTTKEFGGTGLGLIISKQLTELMNGEIWFESQPNLGSTFSFTVVLDIANDDSNPTIDQTRSVDLKLQQALEHLQQKRILLVEDNEINLELVQELLTAENIQVDTAENGETAVKKVFEQTYDLVLMDCQMPIMDGYSATKKIRQASQFAQLPILALTANVMKEDQLKALNAGMNDHIAKPIDPDNLFKTMAKWVSSR